MAFKANFQTRPHEWNFICENVKKNPFLSVLTTIFFLDINKYSQIFSNIHEWRESIWKSWTNQTLWNAVKVNFSLAKLRPLPTFIRSFHNIFMPLSSCVQAFTYFSSFSWNFDSKLCIRVDLHKIWEETFEISSKNRHRKWNDVMWKRYSVKCARHTLNPFRFFIFCGRFTTFHDKFVPGPTVLIYTRLDREPLTFHQKTTTLNEMMWNMKFEKGVLWNAADIILHGFHFFIFRGRFTAFHDKCVASLSFKACSIFTFQFRTRFSFRCVLYKMFFVVWIKKNVISVVRSTRECRNVKRVWGNGG